VLADREVSPQLGLLKSTLLLLDSSFSERDYGASTFRDFAEKLEQRGLVTLKHSGRTTVVELSDAGAREQIVQDMPPDAAAPMPDMPRASEEDEDGTRDSASPVAAAADNRGSGEPSPNLADGVALVRAILAEATTPPRWPMYLRQMKQFIRSARPDFDERRYGSLPDLMRACQKDGLLRLERDRQGGLRAFSGPGTFKPAPVPHGWAALAAESEGGGESEAESESTSETQPRHEAESQPQLEAQGPSADPQADEDAQPQFPEVQQEAAAGESEDEDDQLAMFGKVSPLDPEPKAKRPSRARKTGGITDVPRGGVKPRRSPVARGRTADPGLPSRAPRRRPVKK
jgi:hypothetical protein